MGSIPVGVTKIAKTLEVEWNNPLFYFFSLYNTNLKNGGKAIIGFKLNMEDKKNENVSKKIIWNIIILIIIEAFLSVLYVGSYKLEENIFFYGIKYASFLLLLISIIIFEIAYRKDKGTIAISGIETLILSINTLVSVNVIKKLNISFQNYIIGSIIVFFLYYILKIIIIYTKYKREYLKGLSDIQEIVNTKPIKKEAKKKEIE